MKTLTLVILARAALQHPAAAAELQQLAANAGVPEAQWETMLATLTMPAPDPAAYAARVAESEPAGAHLSSSASHSEWLAVEPRDDDPQWNDGDAILFRELSSPGGITRNEYMVVAREQPLPVLTDTALLRYVKKPLVT